MQILDHIGSDNATDILYAVIESAKKGNIRADEIILKHCWPEEKCMLLSLALSTLVSSEDILIASQKIMQAVGDSCLTLQEAQALYGLLETQRKFIEQHD